MLCLSHPVFALSLADDWRELLADVEVGWAQNWHLLGLPLHVHLLLVGVGCAITSVAQLLRIKRAFFAVASIQLLGNFN